MSERWHPSKDKITVTILNGYIRKRVDESFYVPSDVQLVICSFIGYRFMYEGQYTWTVDTKLLKQIKNSDNQRRFLSGTFEINQLEWQIEAYPNGYKPNEKDIGSFQIFLKLIKVPNSFTDTADGNPYNAYNNHNYKLIIFRRIFSQQVKSSYSRISQYVSGTSKGWADYCLSLNEIRGNAKLRYLNFTIQLQILRIYEEHQHSRWVSPTTIIYQNHILYKQRLDKQSFKWIIKDELMELMHNTYPGKQFESEFFNKMWCLNIAPNGASPKWHDYFDVFLVLCTLPEDIRNINVRWAVSIESLNVKTVRDYWFNFDKKDCNDCWTNYDDEKVLSFSEFKLHDEVILCLDIEIMNMIDHNNKKVKDFDKYLVKGVKNKDELHKNDNDNMAIDQVMESFGENAFQIYNIEEKSD